MWSRAFSGNDGDEEERDEEEDEALQKQLPAL